MIVIRAVEDGDLSQLLELNEAAVPHVNSIPLEEMEWFKEHARFFWVAEVNDRIAGLLIVLAQGIPYRSVNYQWFSNAYTSFAYVDRIIVSETARGEGVGKALYQKLFEESRSFTDIVACEVNIEPPNPRSLKFHSSMGFSEVGKQRTERDTKTVSLLIKNLTG